MTLDNNIKDQRDKLNKASSSISTSILDKIKKFKATSKNTLLIDLSGSMTESVSEDGIEYTSKWQIAQNLITKLPDGVAKYIFNSEDTCEKLFTNTLPRPSGSTALDSAFDKMKSEGKREIVLITDGQADDPDGAIRSAKGLKIDIVYIGPKPAPDFLNDLANASGGSFVDIDLLHKGATLELENKVTLLLGA